MTASPVPQTSASSVYPLAPSWWLAAILAAGHIGVAALILILEISVVWRVVVLVVLLASWIYEVRMAALLRAADAVIALKITPDNALSIQLRNSAWHDCEVLGSTCVTAGLTVINLRQAGRRRLRNVVLLPDSMPPDDYRRLRVWLRWRPSLKPD